jgi:hypothetical protein
MRKPCPSCGSILCDYRECYFATSEPEDEETISTVTLDELMRARGMGDAATPPLCGPDGLSHSSVSQAKPAAAIARKAA